MSDFEQRRLDELKRIADSSEAVSAMGSDMLDALKALARREAGVTAAEVATETMADAHLEHRSNLRALVLRLAAGMVFWVWLSVCVVDWHAHRHLGLEQFPLQPASPGLFPVGVMYTVVSGVLVVGLLWASKRTVNGNGS